MRNTKRFTLAIMLNGIVNTLFGELTRKSCIVFLIISAASIGIFVLIIAYGVYALLHPNPNVSESLVLGIGNTAFYRNRSPGAAILPIMVISATYLFYSYFVNRLMYTMCTKELRVM